MVALLWSVFQTGSLQLAWTDPRRWRHRGRADEFIRKQDRNSAELSELSACGATMSAAANLESFLCITNRWKWKRQGHGATLAGRAHKNRFSLSIHHFHQGPLVLAFDARPLLRRLYRTHGAFGWFHLASSGKIMTHLSAAADVCHHAADAIFNQHHLEIYIWAFSAFLKGPLTRWCPELDLNL